jgi:N4-gp56 family major capsid protein
MDTRDFVQKAYDSNAFTTGATSAGYINPEIWDKQLLEHVKANLVLANLGKMYDMRGGAMGDTLNITIGVEPSAAAAVAESASVAVDAFAKTQVVFSPSERGKAYQLTNKEKDRTFIDLMSDMMAQLGYSLALKVDSDLVTLLQGSAGNAVVAEGVASSAIASSNTIDIDDIINGKKEIFLDKLTPYALVVGFEQLADIEKDLASKSTNLGDTITQNGYVGRYAGLDVYVTTQIAAGSNKAKALILAKDGMGLPAFGIAIKRDPYIETEYHALERYTDIVAVMDYDVKLLRANGVCTVESYVA